jgi:hypothetical protein
MKRVLCITIITLIGVTFSANAGMKLKLRSDLSTEKTATLGNHNFESNMQLKLPAQLAPSGKMELLKGLFLIGLALDVTFPIGDDFSNFAGTGYSGHAFVAYMIARSLMLTLSVGYIKFGDKEESQDFGDGESYTQTNSHSQIPILFGFNYLFNMKGALRAYLGLALGLFLLSDTYSFTSTFFGQTDSSEQSESSSKFGIVPRFGLMYMTAAIIFSLEVTYSLIFHEAGNEGSSNLAHLGILFGIMFALGN